MKTDLNICDTPLCNCDKETNDNYLAVVTALCADVNNIFLIDREEETITVIRSDYAVFASEANSSGKYDYTRTVNQYVKNNVFPKDRDGLSRHLKLDYICKRLREEETVSAFYRVFREDEIHYFRLKCTRIGEPDSFTRIVFAFVSEDFNSSQTQMINALEKDEITALFTKQAFYHHASELLEKNPDMEFDLIVTDVENFKLVNSIYGRSVGDQVLRYLAEIYTKAARGGIAARYGADQFVILSRAMAEEEIPIFYQLVEYFKKGAPLPYLNVRYGINRKIDRKDTIAEMCDKAMLALRSNKNYLENPVMFYDDDVINKHFRSQMYESRFEAALEKEEFVVWCQPKYNTFTGKMTSAEALVRWKTEDGFISPGEFIPVFEADGLITKLDEYVFKYVCQKQKEIIAAGYEPVPISVNMSRATLFRADSVERYSRIIDSAGIQKKLVPIEVTETSMDNCLQLNELISNLRKDGFIVHMDDFGAGYSSLSILSSLNFDVLKLDKSLIDGIGNKRGDEILRHIVELAHFLQMEVVAEGVEENVQYNFLKKLNCDTIQGFLFSKPLPYQEFLELYKAPSEEESEIMDSMDFTEESSVGSLRITNDAKLQYLTALSSVFMTMHVIDLKEDTVVEFNTTTNVKAHVNRVHNAPAQMEAAMRATVADEDIPAVLEFTDLRTIKKRMKNKRTIAEEFMGKHFGRFRARFIMVTADADGEPEKIIYTTNVISADKTKDKILIEACRTDELTGVMNKTAFDEDLAEISEMMSNEPERVKRLAAISSDIVGLKEINDEFGHAVGDELIWGSADIMNTVLGKDSRIYRVEDDVFIGLFCADEKAIEDVRMRYEKAVEDWMGNKISKLSTAYGIAGRCEFREHTLKELIEKAEERRLEHKKTIKKKK